MDHNKSILIVDDSPVVVQVVKSILYENTYENIGTASGALEAIDILEKSPFDMILLDYQMPDKNGEYVLDFVKEKYPATVVIMLSGQQEKDIVVRLMRKADNYIIKDNLDHVKNELINAIVHAFDLQQLKDENKRLMEKIKERNDKLEQQLKIARSLLREVFPKKIEKSPVYEIDIFNSAWDVIGGDFYSVIRLDKNKIGIFLGDICGHGIEAALLLFTLSNAFKESARNNDEAIKTLEELNAMVRSQFPHGSFVTCHYLILDDREHEIEIASASDTPILHLGQNRKISEIRRGELSCIGLIDLNEKANKTRNFFEKTSIKLGDGERLFLFTDGILEARNKSNLMFGLERVEKVLIDNHVMKANDTMKAVDTAVRDFTDNKVTDDMTIIAISKKNRSPD